MPARAKSPKKKPRKKGTVVHKYVSIDETPEEFEKGLAEAFADAEAGRTIPFEEFWKEVDKKISRMRRKT